MKSNNFSKVLWTLAIFCPIFVSCQSRGEVGVRGPISTAANANGYIERNSQQYHFQDHVQHYNPQYIQTQTQSQSYPHAIPSEYNNQNSYYNQQQPNIQQNNRPAPYVPQLNYGPISPPKKVYPSQQSTSLDSRFGPGDVQNIQEDFMTRPPGTKRPIVTTKKPPSFVQRFDDRDDQQFKKKLNFNPQLSNNMEAFALELLYQLCNSKEDVNFMISPFSVYNMLVMLAEGAIGNTYEEINKKLKLIDLPKTRDFQQYLNVALNRSSADVVLKKFALMVTDMNRPVKREYEDLIEKLYEAEVLPVSFANPLDSLQKINGYVSGQTQGLITDTVSKDDLFKAQLILISGLFFKGRWMNVFNQTFTKKEPFYDTNYLQIGNVNMMFQRGPFAYSPVQELGCHILELPYATIDEGGSSLSMILVLPRKGLSIEQAIMNVYQFGMEKMYKEFALSKAEYEDEEVEVHIPRFEIETSFNLKDTLESMEIIDIFDQNRADLSNINTRYFVSSMVHKTKISVDEQGTTAAAVTTSIFANKATPPKFHANKPFLFFIVDKITKLILFSGQYVVPSVY